MTRRGPDSEGFWDDPEGHLCLGFRRLAILDLSRAGNQPMHAHDNRSVIIFNGEIYNHRDLRAQLETLGHTFHTRSDTEILLAALTQWGVDALSRLNGMFALAWYQRQTHTLLLARDHAGIKPLYYYIHPSGRGVAFGSQYDLLLQTPWGTPGTLRPDVLKLYLSLNHIPAPYGLLENTHQLEPGHYLLIHANGLIENRSWWTLPFDPEPNLSGPAALDALQSAIQAALQRQRLSDVPLGVFLSGGIDSPLVTAVARQQTGPEMQAFTISNPGWGQDESADAVKYASVLDVNHKVYAVSAEQALETIPGIIAAQHEPFADFSIIPAVLVCAFARQDITVALSGDGGDELLFGYERPRSLLRNGQDFRFPQWARYSMYALGRLQLGPRRSEAILARNPGDYYFGVNARFGGEVAFRRVAPSLSEYPPDFDLYAFDRYQGQRHLLNFSRTVEFYGQLQRGLKKMDMASMFHSLEVRVPLLDREVIDVALRIDPFDSLRNDSRKLVLRNLLGRYVPPDTIPQAKRGFAVPLGDWLRGPLRGLAEDTLFAQNTYPAGLFSRNDLRIYWKEHLSGQVDHKWGLWALLTLQWWAKQHA
jgi:asparagine synthase (glutamine-hydrolysing)